MRYKISICHPDSEEIETLSKTFSNKEAHEFFDNYPWKRQLELLGSMNQEEVHYNPSVRFTNAIRNISLELTAELKDGEIVFSLWYERPIMSKILFGLLGEREKMKLTEKWGFNFVSSRVHLLAFLEENYDAVERAMID